MDRCLCRPGEAERYLQRVSGPLLDRIDCFVAMPRVAAQELLRAPDPEPSEPVARRIATAWALAVDRNRGRTNADLGGRSLRQVAHPEAAASLLLERLAERSRYSARATHRALRVARTVADLRGHARVTADDVAAAVALREPDPEERRRAA